MDEQRWPGEWKRGALPLCVLGALAEEPRHGYAVAARLEAAGLGTVKGGTLYPILTRHERDGYVTATWVAGEGGPGRKVFTVTPLGLEHLHAHTERWQRFTEVAATLLPVRREAP